MLNPNNRSLYTDALSAPPGMQFDEAIGTTYSLDPALLLAVPLQLAMYGSESGDRGLDRIALLESLRRLSGKITLYAQRGRLQIPDSSSVLYGLLEEMVVEALAPQGGAFHPKLWVVRFTSPDDPRSVLIRLLVLSRNLTADRSWDIALTLDGHPTGRRRKENLAISELIAKLPEMAFRRVSKERKDQAARLGSELRRVEWELPSGFEEVSFEVLGLKRKVWKPGKFTRLAVISPFCRDRALEAVAKTSDSPVALISRPDEIARLADGTVQRFQRCLVLAEEAETEDGEDCGTAAVRDTCGLHAKVFVFEKGRSTHVVLGSANATNAALVESLNVEVMAELIGKKSQIGGVDALLGPDGLAEFLNDYVKPDEVQAEDKELRKAEANLEAARKAIAASKLRIKCVKDSKSGNWRLELVGRVAPLVGISEAKGWPISISDAHAVDLSFLPTNGRVKFRPVSAESITGLIGVELRTLEYDLKVRFALNLPLDGLAEERDIAILKTVVGNKEGFLRYLLFLLGDLGFGFEVPKGANDETGRDWSISNFDSMPLLEELVRAYCRDPKRLVEVSNVVQQLSNGGAPEDVVPEQFMKTWSVFEVAVGIDSGGDHE